MLWGWYNTRFRGLGWLGGLFGLDFGTGGLCLVYGLGMGCCCLVGGLNGCGFWLDLVVFWGGVMCVFGWVLAYWCVGVLVLCCVGFRGLVCGMDTGLGCYWLVRVVDVLCLDLVAF